MLKYVWNTTFVLLSPIICTMRLLNRIYKKCNNSKMPEEKITKNIAKQLADNWDYRGGYNAGLAQYANVWTRDSFFALFAPIESKKDKLISFTNRLKNDIKNNHVPFTYHSTFYVSNLICTCLPCKKRKNPEVSYLDEKLANPVMDSNSQYIIMVYEAYKCMNDNLDQANKFVDEHKNTIKSCLKWYDNYKSKNGLITEKPFGNWEDSILHSGEIPYTNVLYLYACKIGYKLFNIDYDQDLTRKVEDLVLNPYIQGGIDTVSLSLLTLWGTQMDINMDRLKFYVKSMNAIYPKNKLIPNRIFKLPLSNIFLPNIIIGQEAYHNGWCWSWVGCLFCAALVKMDMKESAQTRLNLYTTLKNKYGTLHEVYHNEKPVDLLFYKSERSFSEAIGCYMYAKNLLN